MRTRDLLRRQREAEEGIAACTAALERFPGDPSFTRSLAIWRRRLDDATRDLADRRRRVPAAEAA